MNFLDTTLGSGVALESGMRRGTAQPRGGALMRFAEIETFWLRIEPRQTQSSLFQIVPAQCRDRSHSSQEMQMEATICMKIQRLIGSSKNISGIVSC